VRGPAQLDGTPLAADDRVLVAGYEATDPSSAGHWVEASLRRFGGIDTVIHCAGVFSRVEVVFADGQEAQIERLWRVNVMGPWWLSRAVWPALRASGRGRVITLVSMSGKRVLGRVTAAYASSKFALMGLCHAMRNEGWDDGIRVTAICPSYVNTDMAAAVEGVAPEAMTQPEDLAAHVSLLLRLPASAVPFELAVSCQREG
jgi:NAD(P)-dependent dehydrogenase (short-subunit alcohol dehydrogenase family)